jgi:hypothetical protein
MKWSECAASIEEMRSENKMVFGKYEGKTSF